MIRLDPELAIAAGRVDLLIDQVRAAASIAERRFALDALARGLLTADPGSVPPALLDEARTLRVDGSTIMAATAERSPHAVSVPLVARGDFGFVRQVHVTFDPAGLADHDLLEGDARRAIADAIDAAARRTPPPSEPSHYCLVAAQPQALRHARVEGRSLAAAAFVSASALFTGRGVRPEIAITGALGGERVLPVGGIEEKVAGAIAHGLTSLVVPRANETAARDAALGSTLTIMGVDDVGSLLDVALLTSATRQHPERAVAEAREHAAKGWSGYRWPSIRERLARVSGTLPEYRIDLRVEVLARLAAAQRHIGDPQGSLRILRRAEALAQSDEGRRAVPDAPLCDLYMQMAMTSRQLSRFAEASRAATRAVKVARGARLRRELIKALGCLGLVAMARGHHARAIEAFEESLAIMLRHEPDRTARTHAYLIEAHAGARNEAEARAHFDAAMDDLDAAHDAADRRSRESWVRTSWGGALVALGRPHEAAEALEVDSVATSIAEEPLPGLLARRHLGVALARSGEADRGLMLLAASPLVYGRALEPHLAFVAHLNVLFEARERIALGAFGRDIAGRARRALDHIPDEGPVGAFLGPSLARSRTLLERSAPRTSRPLDALLARCVRLG